MLGFTVTDDLVDFIQERIDSYVANGESEKAEAIESLLEELKEVETY